MATIASLLVNLGMNTAKFEQGTKRAQVNLQSLANAAIAVNSAMGIAGTVMRVASRALDSFADKSQFIDDIGKAADRTGFATESLAALGHAAGLAGVDTATLSGALQKMSVNVAKAANGGKAQAEVFEQLGLNAKELVDVAPERMLGAIADALKTVPTEAERLNMALSIFGKSGAGMVNVLADGSEGLAKMHEEAERLGLTFDRLSAYQVEQANDAMTRMQELFKGMQQQLVIGLAPAIEGTAVFFRHFSEEMKQGNVLFAYSDAMRTTVNEFNNLQPSLNSAADAQRRLAEATEKAAEAAKKQKAELAQLKKFYQELSRRDQGRLNLMEEFQTPQERLEAKRDEIANARDELESDYRGGLLRADQYEYRKSGLDTAEERLQKQMQSQQKDEYDDSALGQIRKRMKSREQQLKEDLAKAEEDFGDPFAEELGLPGKYEAEKRFAQLEARKRYLQAGPDDEMPTDFRSAALEKGTAAAFSASFGPKPVEKKLSEIAQIDRQILETMQRIDAKTVRTTVASI